MLDRIAAINQEHFSSFGDPETLTRIAQYEMAFRMQTSVPGLMDLNSETAGTKALYGPDIEAPGSFARNCLIARKLAEQGVPFVQLFHRGWDQHGSLPKLIRGQCESIDHPIAGLITDLKQRGLLETTLVIWGAEFGRTPFSQGSDGRDHNQYGFSMWLAGGGIAGGRTFGATDEYGYKAVDQPVEIHDLHATMLHLLGIDHERLTKRFGGRDMRLTDVHGRVMHDWIT